MKREISSYVDGEVPATQAAVEKIVANNLRSQPGDYETAGSGLGTIAGIVRYDRQDNWVELRHAQLPALTPATLNAAARTKDPEALPVGVDDEQHPNAPPVHRLIT